MKAESPTMDEIRRLQAELAAVQLQDTAHRISDRNCIDIILKLQQLKLIDLIYTTDGKEFLTPAQLEREIVNELLGHDGRISIVQLSPLLNVDLHHIEKSIPTVVSDSSIPLWAGCGRIHLCGGELVTDEYVDRVADAVNVVLQARGSIALSEVVSLYNGLSIEFVRQQLHDRLLSSGRIAGHISSDSAAGQQRLVTRLWAERERARLRGSLLGTTRPRPVAEVRTTDASREKQQNHDSSHNVNLTKALGDVRRGQWEPQAFGALQRLAVRKYAGDNEVLDAHQRSTLGVNSWKELDDLLDPQCRGVKLQAAYVTPRGLAAIEAALHGVESWCDMAHSTAVELSTKDCTALIAVLQRTGSTGSKDAPGTLSTAAGWRVFGDRWAVRHAWLNESLVPASLAADASTYVPSPPPLAVLQALEIAPSGAPGSAVGNGGGGKRGDKRGDREGAEVARWRRKRSAECVTQLMPVIAGQLRQSAEDAGRDADADQQLVDQLARELAEAVVLPVALKARDERDVAAATPASAAPAASATTTTAGAGVGGVGGGGDAAMLDRRALKQRHAELEGAMQRAFERFCVAATILPDGEDGLNPRNRRALQRYVTATCVTPLVQLLVEDQCLYAGITVPADPSDRTADVFDDNALRDAIAAVARSSAPTDTEQLLHAAPLAYSRRSLRRPDRKTERQVVFGERQRLHALADESPQPVALCVAYLLARHTGTTLFDTDATHSPPLTTDVLQDVLRLHAADVTVPEELTCAVEAAESAEDIPGAWAPLWTAVVNAARNS